VAKSYKASRRARLSRQKIIGAWVAASVLGLFCLASSASANNAAPGLGPSSTKTTTSVEWWIDKFGSKVRLYVPPKKDDPDTPPSDCPTCVVHTKVTTEVTIPDPSSAVILSGRVTYSFEPGDVAVQAGWFGEFGADPLMPAPVPGDVEDGSSPSLLQPTANPLMSSSSIVVDDTLGTIVFQFDWGPNGFLPTRNLDANGHFNIGAVFFARNDGIEPDISLVISSDFSPTGPSYTLCSADRQAYSCGVHPIPEPSTWFLTLMGFGALGATLRLRRRGRGVATV
jgi:hypothetical protein